MFSARIGKKENIKMEKVRVQDDLFHYVNGEWLENAVIPDDKPTAGGFAELRLGVEDLLMKEYEDMSVSGEYPSEYVKNSVLLYKQILDTKKRDELGIKPVQAKLDAILALKDIKDFNAHLTEFVLNGMPLPFNVSVDEDMKDTTHYCIFVDGPSVILPDTTYYKEEMAEQKEKFLGVWSKMVETILAKTSLSKKEQKQFIEDALKFDESLAPLVLSHEEASEYTKMYNPYKLSRVNSLLKPVAYKKMINEIFGDVETIIVAEPRYYKGFKTVFNEETFENYKHWAYINLLLGSCSILTEELRELSAQYRLTLMGVAKIPEIKRYAYNVASDFYSEPVGLYYGEKYFGAEAKKDVIEMVEEIVETYKNRIKKNDFLSDATKEKAIVKLSKMGLKMAYPDKVDEIYDLLKVDDSKSLYENITELRKVRRLDRFKKLGTVVDRTHWVMPGHMVNACYNPSLNDITFPAAILQAPFYSLKQTRSENLGGIGAVIAHEISHAFDNNGAKCDENGNLNNWWTKEDFKKFNARTKKMAREFDGIELPWGTVNGKFIVSENIADNGGMAATLEIMSNMKDANYEEYFLNWGRIWCIKARPEYQTMLLSVDVHAPAILRANMQPRNFEEWYTTFNVKKTDKMYLAPSKRVSIW